MKTSWLSSPYTPEERLRIACAATKGTHKGSGSAALIPASVLHFESMDRAEQARAIIAHKVHRAWDTKSYLTVRVPPIIAGKVKAWDFGMVNRGGALRAAVLSFIELPKAEQQEWNDEAFIFVTTHEKQD